MSGAPSAPIRSGSIRYLFSDASAGDLRRNPEELASYALVHAAPEEIARVRQVHGAEVVRVETGGDHGEADALFTTEPDLTLAVFVADCAAVVLGGDHGVGLAHAGWRGAAAGVVTVLMEKMHQSGIAIEWAALSPMIGPCCFEVGPEVVAQFPTLPETVTTWGTPSVDLGRAIATQLAVPVAISPGCTMHDERYLSFRRMRQLDRGSLGGDSDARMAALAWRAG